ncbi:MAG: AAA family ATPase [Phycisphaeraceae bacterium]
MAQPLIKSIDLLRRLPVFPEHKPGANAIRFRRFNLIYGFNGCGKTTLSRVFSVLGSGALHPEWADDCTFTISLSDGSRITPDSHAPALQKRILVFNPDFVTANIRWHQGDANPIVYIGKEQHELSRSLEATVAELQQADADIQNRSRARAKAAQMLATHKTDRARLIANELNLGRQYDARHLDGDYGRYEYADEDRLTDAALEAQRAVLRRDTPKPKVHRLGAHPIQIRELFRMVQDLLPATLGSLSIEELRQHDEMLSWVRRGLDYHKTHKLQSCLLCGHHLTSERIRALESAIDSRYDKLITSIDEARRTAANLRAALDQRISDIPAKHDIVDDQHDSLDSASSKARAVLSEVMRYIDTAAGLLAQKRDSPNREVDTAGVPEESLVTTWETDLKEQFQALNRVIDAHNKAYDEFERVRKDAGEAIKRHYLNEGHAKYHELCGAVATEEEVLRELKEHHNTLQTTHDNLKQKMRRHGPAAHYINSLIQRYLGHRELEIAGKDDGYEIRRNGKIASAPPSEGEQTAIALCYFLVLLEADGRRRGDLIVVLDDPVSSLDSRSLNYACNLIRSLDNVGQLIILTHHIHAMNELKKWLLGRTESGMDRRGRSRDDATATLAFVDTIQPDGESSRRSSLIELPRHLRDYESEYHYLFHMVLRFLNSKQDRGNYFFVMPNVLRKVLEAFLSFKMPGPEGLSSKIGNLVQRADQIGVDALRVRALERLAHVESHGDSIDDLISLPSMTVEEVEDAAQSLLGLIEKLDSEHWERMRSLCAVKV